MQLLFKNFEINNDINNEWILENCYVAGGACVSNYTRKQINDVDIYFKTKEARDFFMKHYDHSDKYITKDEDLWKCLLDIDSIEGTDTLTKKYEDSGFEIEREMRSISKDEQVLCYNIVGEGTVAKPLLEKQKWMFEHGYDYVLLHNTYFNVEGSDDTFLGNKSITIKHNDIKYQFILRFYGEPEQMMNDTFDFQHCKIAYDLKERKYIASEETWQALCKKELIYVNSYYPISSLKRLNKYHSRDFRYSNDTFLNILKDISKLDLNDKYLVEDQMIGYYEDFNYDVVFNDLNIVDDLFLDIWE